MGEESLPLIMSTPDGVFAMGAWTPYLPDPNFPNVGYGKFDFSFLSQAVDKTNKWTGMHNKITKTKKNSEKQKNNNKKKSIRNSMRKIQTINNEVKRKLKHKRNKIVVIRRRNIKPRSYLSYYTYITVGSLAEVASIMPQVARAVGDAQP